MNSDELPNPDSNGYWYLAGPYTNSPMERYEQHLEASAILIKNGYVIYSPIVHCHPMALKYQLPGNFEFWQRFNHVMITWSNGVLLLKLPGWEKSGGVRDELNFCFDNNIKVWGVDPITVGSEFISIKWLREM